MKNAILLLIIIVSFCLYNCNSSSQENYIAIKNPFSNKAIIDSLPKQKKTKLWHLKDIVDDTLAGISLEKAYNTILKHKKTTPVIVGVIDGEIDPNHSAYKQILWTNPLEIVNNGIDDDNNGYVDDSNGWNFLGNHKGESVIIENYEYVRIVRELESKVIANQLDTLSKDYTLYKRARKKMDKKLISTERTYHRVNKMMDFYYESREALKDYFPNYNYSYEVLSQIDTTGNGLSKYVEEIRSVLEYKDTDENMVRNHKRYRDNFEKKININYTPRDIIGDNPFDITDSIYGNNRIGDHLDIYTHGTRVTGVLATTCKGCLEKENLQVLPVVIVPDGGNTQDKDIALGIKYAVNQGARVINMSFGKTFAFHNEWVIDAMKYAEKHDVLLIAAAGNGNDNIDTSEHLYPNDQYGDEPEFCDNLLYVGATARNLGASIVPYSDYGKKTVDIFAPGEEIYTTYPNNEYKYDSGTSLAAAITSKVAALIFSHYPNLTASQVKHIIMDSGVEYTFPVKTPTRKDKDKMTPFNELSKSGKIVNAYNALIMADSISRKH
ncbi:S8 family serine peptidase [Pontimicrobium sp. MEBiC06410]